MREIKFRAWDKETKIMLAVNTLALKSKYCEPSSSFSHDFKDGNCHLFSADTIFMQYTELKDKKRTTEYPEGQEIYEGDIVNVPYNYIGNRVVVFEEGKYNITNYLLSKLEVIGNIYENPELLEAKDDKQSA